MSDDMLCDCFTGTGYADPHAVNLAEILDLHDDMTDDRVLQLMKRSDGTFRLQECCDYVYELDLTADQVRRFAHWLLGWVDDTPPMQLVPGKWYRVIDDDGTVVGSHQVYTADPAPEPVEGVEP